MRGIEAAINRDRRQGVHISLFEVSTVCVGGMFQMALSITSPPAYLTSPFTLYILYVCHD